MVLFCGLKAEFFSITNQELRIVKRKRRINMVEKVYPMTLEGKEFFFQAEDGIRDSLW